MPRSFNDLEIWKSAHKLTILIYQESMTWPESERYNLISQIRRAAVSVELLISEGHSRYHNKDIIHFMHESRASAEEVRNCLMIARDLPHIPFGEKFELLNIQYIGLIKGINAFINSLR